MYNHARNRLMWLVPTCIVVFACAAVGTSLLVSQEGEKRRAVRESLFWAKVPDGSELQIRTRLANWPDSK